MRLPFVFMSRRDLTAKLTEARLQGQVLQARRTKNEMAYAHGAHEYGNTIASLETWAWHRLKAHRGTKDDAPKPALYTDTFAYSAGYAGFAEAEVD